MRVLLGGLVRDGVRVRVLVPVREEVGVRVLVAVAVLVAVLSGVKTAVAARVADGVWVTIGVAVTVREVMMFQRGLLSPATNTRPSRNPTTEFICAESTDTTGLA